MIESFKMTENNLKNVVQLRFILQQPSVYWKDFSIDKIKFYLTNSVRLIFFFLKDLKI